MNEQMPPVEPVAEEPKKNNTTLYIIIGVVVLCCCCVVGSFVFYQFLGDPLMEALGLM